MKSKNRAFILAAPILASFIQTAQSAPWQQITSNMYSQPDTENSGYNLSISLNNNTNKNRAAFVFANYSLCSQHPNYSYDEPISYKVNGQFVNFKGICIQSIFFLTPHSDAGQEYLNREVRKEKTVTIIVNNGDEVTFETTGAAEVERAIDQTKSAL